MASGTEAVCRAYVAEIDQAKRLGNATEHTYRPALKTLLEALVPGITATNEPKRVACGAPDYVISRTEHHGPLTIGYVEAKDLNEPLAQTERGAQLTRYRQTLANLLLTDYLEFRWYVNGQPRLAARLAHVDANGRVLADAASIEQVAALLHDFLARSPEPIRSPQELAKRMAGLTHQIRDIMRTTLDAEHTTDQETAKALTPIVRLLKDLHATIQQVLIPNLSLDDFADMFAQTLAYGLFAARCNHQGPEHFSRQSAARDIPRTNPFLRKLFEVVSGTELDDAPFAGFVDDLAQMLAQTDMAAVLADFGKRTRQEDPIVHFYETFLAAYDPKVREMRGVYYTPEPVVSYIVRSVDVILRKHFHCPAGIAEATTITRVTKDAAGREQSTQVPRVLILDPACGTSTFLYAAINHIREAYQHSGNMGMWSAYVREAILPRIFGFELLMAPYAMAHLKLGMQLAGYDLPSDEHAQLAYDFAKHERLGIYLTNSLEPPAQSAQQSALTGFIWDEAEQAATIKQGQPVMVIMGNPPYSGHSANKGDWITALMRGSELVTGMKGQGERATADYFKVDGQPLGEKNPKWLNDDYVKFIRFAQWRIERTGHGVLAFVTNHGYLDNPTFRGMRQSLMRAFDEIYLLDLHGNSKKKERAPGGGKDENVFDIQQGVAIGIFIRRESAVTAPRAAKVYHAHLYGVRASKYAWLAERDRETTEWTALEPQAPFYLFTPQDRALATEYEQGWRVPDMMPLSSMGIATARDALTIHYTREEVWRTVSDFGARTPEDARSHYSLGSDTRDWQVALAQADVRKSGPSQSNIQPIDYRPFDTRYTYYTGTSRGFQCMPRPEVMRNMLAGRNVGLVTNRQVNGMFQHVLCTRVLVDSCTVSLETRERSYLLPLYHYPDLSKPTLLEDQPATKTPGGRRANLAPEFVAEASRRLRLAWAPDGCGDLQATFGPEDVFHYMYAIFHSPTYRARYAEFLKADFPRLPLADDVILFRKLCGLGSELVALHLMERQAPRLTRYPVPGNHFVETLRYTAPSEGRAAQGRVWINATQYFEGVPPEVWPFCIGGYQVAHKWLKDRKGRTLTLADLEHYHGIIAALAETQQLMEVIDEVIDDHGGWPITPMTSQRAARA